jgi:hypothetical protein
MVRSKRRLIASNRCAAPILLPTSGFTLHALQQLVNSRIDGQEFEIASAAVSVSCNVRDGVNP